MRVVCIAAVAMLALALSACGESDEEKAMNTVCDARDDIAEQADELNSLTLATVTTDAVTQNLDAIQNDLNDIADAQSDLSDDRRSEVEAATNEFTSSVKNVASDLGPPRSRPRMRRHGSSPGCSSSKRPTRRRSRR